MLYHKIFKLLPDSLQQLIRNWHYENKLRKATKDDEIEIKLIEQMLDNGDVALDIGANYGYYSKYLSEFCGMSGKVFAFEPIDKVYITLLCNITALNLFNVTPMRLALSNRIGSAKMVVPEYENGGENYYEASIENNPEDKGFRVDLSTMDAFLPEAITVRFVKCDVEGHELKVLEGGKRVLSTYRPIVMLEINGGIHAENKNAREIVGFMSLLDYKVYAYDGEMMDEVKEDHMGHNFFFLHTKHQDEFVHLIRK